MRTLKVKALGKRNSARMKMSLATCSLVLVLFGVVVYVAAVPGIFVHDSGARLLAGLLSSDVSLDGGASSETEGESGLAFAETGNSANASSGSLSPSPSLTLGGLSSAAASLVQASENASSNSSPSSSVSSSPSKEENPIAPIIDNILDALPNESSSGGSSSTNKPDVPTESDLKEVEAEKAHHDFIAKYYNEAKPYYDQICAAYSGVFSQIEDSSSPSAKTSTSPMNPNTFIGEVEQKRLAILHYKYDGKEIPRDSKWYGEYMKVFRLYENLVNATSILREVDGVTKERALQRLQYYADENGKIPPLVKFEQYYANIHL